MRALPSVAFAQLLGPSGIDNDFGSLAVIGPVFRANVLRPLTYEIRTALCPLLLDYSYRFSFRRTEPQFRVDDQVWMAFNRISGLHFDCYRNFSITLQRAAALHYLRSKQGLDSLSIGDDASAITMTKLTRYCGELSEALGVEISPLLFANRFLPKDFTGEESDWEHGAARKLPKRSETQRLLSDAFRAAGFKIATKPAPLRATTEIDDGGTLIAVDFDFASSQCQVAYQCHVLSPALSQVGPYSVESWFGIRTGNGLIDGLHNDNMEIFLAGTVALAEKIREIGKLVKSEPHEPTKASRVPRAR